MGRPTSLSLQPRDLKAGPVSQVVEVGGRAGPAFTGFLQITTSATPRGSEEAVPRMALGVRSQALPILTCRKVRGTRDWLVGRSVASSWRGLSLSPFHRPSSPTSCPKPKYLARQRMGSARKSGPAAPRLPIGSGCAGGGRLPGEGRSPLPRSPAPAGAGLVRPATCGHVPASAWPADPHRTRPARPGRWVSEGLRRSLPPLGSLTLGKSPK